MDTAQYLPMFMAEAREHLQELNLAVVRVEETPDDRETVDEIFRIAHSLKGMSATMGFEQMASLTRRAAYCECVIPESRTLQSTASVCSGVMYSPQSIV